MTPATAPTPERGSAPATAACEWCGRAIEQDAEGRWYAVKGEERGYDPLTCEATGQSHTSDTATGATGMDEWLAGYRWALEHLTDPGVLRDAAQYADERGGPLTVTPGHVARSVAEPDAGFCLPVRPAPGHEKRGTNAHE